MELRDLLQNSNKIGIISHINPDADNLGSLTALSESLRKYGKDVTSICIDTIPYNLEFLHGIDKLTNEWDKQYDLLISLDSSSMDRLGNAQKIVNNAKYTLNIDHHISNNLTFDYNIVKPKASSTGEVLYEFLKEYNLPINENVAESIYTAIVGDSGSFKYDTVSPKTLRIAADLLEIGVDKDKINTNLYGKNKMGKIKLLRILLERMTIVKEKKLVYSYLLDSDFEKSNAVDADIEGLVEFLRDIDGIEIALILRQSKLGFKGSTRSKSDYNVSELALKFNGGGHLRAAGFTVLEKDIDKALELVLEKI